VAVYVVRWFRRWMEQQGLVDRDVCSAVHAMARGLIDADLGGGLFKQRLPRNGQGKRGGYRTIVATRKSGNWFFLYGFAKSDRPNISRDMELDCRSSAKRLLGYGAKQCEENVANGNLSEVHCHAQVPDHL
jgi:hypothetical protein